MENYNPVFLQQLAPYIQVKLHDADVESCQTLWTHFQQHNLHHKVWDNAVIRNRFQNPKFIIQSKDISTGIPQREISQTEKHSIISPFNNESELFPNGIINDKWFNKYINDFPFAVVFTFELTKETDVVELTRKINELKQGCIKQQIKIICIIISTKSETEEGGDGNNNGDEDIINQLRVNTGLPRLVGLLYLNGSNKSTLNRDCEILVQSLLSNLKPTALEFYNNIEYKIKQRVKKYYSVPSTSHLSMKIQLSPRSLQARNLIKQSIINQFINYHDLDVSIKFMEQAYQMLIDILKDMQVSLRDDIDISEYDLKLYNQVRTLIDILAFQIVRGLFSTEEPIQALRRHKSHISKVKAIIDPESRLKWVSIQYEWLGQLMKLVPISILNGLNTDAIKKLTRNPSNKVSLFGYFGGIKFDDDIDYEDDIITNSGLIFLKSFNYLDNFISIPSKFNYLSSFDNEHDLNDHKVNLLNESSKLITKDLNSNFISSQEDSFELYSSLINWLLGEQYFKLKNFRNAIENYLACLSTTTNSHYWPQISTIILLKLLQCYSILENKELELSTILKLSLYPSFASSSLSSYKFKFDGVEDNFDISDVSNLFNLNVFIGNETFQPETFVYDTALIQLIVDYKINLNLLLKLMPENTKVELIVNSIQFKIDRLDGGGKKKARGLKNITIVHNPDVDDAAESLKIFKLDDNADKVESNLSQMIAKSNIFQIFQMISSSGFYEIESIKLSYNIKLSHDDKTVTLDKIENFIISNPNPSKTEIPPHHISYYSKSSSTNQLEKKLIRFNSSSLSRNSIKISPLKPNLTVHLHSPSSLNCIILGEKLSVTFKLNFVQPHKKIDYKRIHLSTTVSILNKSNQKSDKFNIRTNWDQFKDDESLDLKALMENGEEFHNLNITINNPPNSVTSKADDEGGYTISIDIKVVILEEEDEEEISAEEDNSIHDSLIYDIAKYNLPMLLQPFQFKYMIGPRIRLDEIDLPSPFLLDSQHPSSMPIATRAWLGKVSIIDNFKTFEQHDKDESPQQLEILDVDYKIKSVNPDLIVDLISDVSKSDDESITYKQLFTIKSKNGYSHRDVQTRTSIVIKWKRQDEEIINTFNSDEWQIVLPLSDPRVLLTIDQLSSDSFILRYILENPTPRIFTFTTHLTTVEEQPQGLPPLPTPPYQWSFDDDRNLIPIRQTPFPVLPFTRHVMEFYGKLTFEEQEERDQLKRIKLPLFKVFDVQYKMMLPTLSVDDHILVSKTGLYWKQQKI
ncbi:Gryzun, putative trafficking through golgi-domain-containing protein [Scheffersomyces coipomensis]|uniref:Gryzun, putative trafficking through golgi-domain-containing protein n=1 Tax=Scheffersomyces coipomensis TaxID=1788519 RepID=UPI00315D4E90